ncbi:hypothetical protein HDU81_003991 [Chytriomyces hyalinus]|nr:hypothetical protein HDU81_003991 [Chytriomyces hyalinus]
MQTHAAPQPPPQQPPPPLRMLFTASDLPLSRALDAISSPLSALTQPDTPPLLPQADPSVPAKLSLKEKTVYKKGHAKGPAKIPRPPNAFILFRTDNQPNLVTLARGLGKSSRDFSSIVAKMWADAPQDVRQHYQKLAAEKFREHKELYPDYRYRPKKGIMDELGNPIIPTTATAKKEKKTGKSADEKNIGKAAAKSGKDGSKSAKSETAGKKYPGPTMPTTTSRKIADEKKASLGPKTVYNNGRKKDEIVTGDDDEVGFYYENHKTSFERIKQIGTPTSTSTSFQSSPAMTHASVLH